MDEDLRNRYRRDYAREPSSDRTKRFPIPKPTPRRSVTPDRTDHTQGAPALALPTPKIEATEEPKRRHKTKRRHRSLRIMVLVIVLLIVTVAVGVFGYIKLSKDSTQSQHYFPSSVTQGHVKMQLYYPTKLPSGYRVNDDFKTPQANVVTYSILDPKNNRYVLAIQPLPDGLNIDDQKTKMLNADSINTSYGSAIVGTTVDGLLAFIRTDDGSLIIIHALNKDTQTQLETIVRSLQQTD